MSNTEISSMKDEDNVIIESVPDTGKQNEFTVAFEEIDSNSNISENKKVLQKICFHMSFHKQTNEMLKYMNFCCGLDYGLGLIAIEFDKDLEYYTTALNDQIKDVPTAPRYYCVGELKNDNPLTDEIKINIDKYKNIAYVVGLIRELEIEFLIIPVSYDDKLKMFYHRSMMETKFKDRLIECNQKLISDYCFCCFRYCEDIKRCSVCTSVFYCSDECGKLNWEFHKPQCMKERVRNKKESTKSNRKVIRRQNKKK